MQPKRRDTRTSCCLRNRRRRSIPGSSRNPNWREQVSVGDLILVVDIGGGTTDFTLISVTEEGGELRLERVAVGEHILLGGDNMDLALARTVEAQLAQKKRKARRDAAQRAVAAMPSRERADVEPKSKASDQPVTILGRGTGLVGGTIKTTLSREDLYRVLLDGFFPVVSSQDMPQSQAAHGPPGDRASLCD